MADYTYELDCGCVNWCRCLEKSHIQEVRRAGFNIVNIHLKEMIYECHKCAALVKDYTKHQEFHKRNDNKFPITLIGE